MMSVFVVFLWNSKDRSGTANAFVEVPKLDKANVAAIPITIMRNNPGLYDDVCVTNIVRLGIPYDKEWANY